MHWLGVWAGEPRRTVPSCERRAVGQHAPVPCLPAGPWCRGLLLLRHAWCLALKRRAVSTTRCPACCLPACRAYDAVTSSSKETWDQAKSKARENWEATKDKTGEVRLLVAV